MNKISFNRRSLVAIAIYLAGMATFSACEDPEMDHADVVYPKGSKLKQISYVESVHSKEAGLIITQYDYDDQGRIRKVSQPMYESGTSMFKPGTIVGLYSYSDYDYNSEGQIEKITYYHSNVNAGFLNLRTYTYTYDANQNKQKEVIVYPQMPQHRVDSVRYFYDTNRLVREEHYEDGYFGSEPWRSVRVNFIEYEYNSLGELIVETNYSGEDNRAFQYSVHDYRNGLQVKTDVFTAGNNQKIREITRYYDKNDNLIYLESEELSMVSSAMSYVVKYDY